ncbi:MAG: hypothetical protein HOW73_29590 [Polyangiaceae bacterium]|nr:hypothetical protein [Polyangiaceae bacterium]
MSRSFLAVAAVSASVGACTLTTDFDRLRGTDDSAEGGAGGEAPTNPCAGGLWPDVCGDGLKCTLATPSQGLDGGITCGPKGSAAAWSVCASDADCADGTWCDASTSVCKPWCTDAGDCPSGAACVSARRTDDTPVPGLTVCTAHCRPDAPTARCGPGANCVIVSSGSPEGDCAAAGETQAGCPCSKDADCAVGLRCASDRTCRAWCSLDEAASCPGSFTCEQPSVAYDGTDFGSCSTLSCPN